MKVGVFTVLLADRPLEDALHYAKEVGCEAVEIGTGGYPGDTHCKPGELLQDSGARDKFRQAVENRDLEIRGLRTVIVTEHDHPYVGAWWPPGHIIGYEHTFVHTIKDLLDGIAAEKSPAPTFEDGYSCQAVLDAVEGSLESGSWTEPARSGARAS